MDDSVETEYCSNCKKDIASANFVMHEVHCKRKLVLCELCSEPVPRDELKEHFTEYHEKIKCDICKQDVEKGDIEEHKENSCKKRNVACPYCELFFPFDELTQHQDACGSRTEKCEKCDQYVMLKDMEKHEGSGCTYPTQRVVKPNEDNTGSSHPFVDDFPPDFSSSFVRSEVSRMLNPVGNGFPQHGGPGLYSHYGMGVPVMSEMRRGRPQPRLRVRESELAGRRKTEQPSKNRAATTVKTTGQHPQPRKQKAAPATVPVQRDVMQDDENETDLLARHLMQDLSLEESGNHQGAVEDDFVLPCEFCGELCAADDLILHQSGCNPELAHQRVRYNKPRFADSPSPPLDAHPSVPVYRDQYNDWHGDYETDVHRNGDPEDDLIELPCEFCGLVFPMIQLVSHQVVCDRNFTTTPAPGMRAPAYSPTDEISDKVFSRTHKRQQDPSFSQQVTRLNSFLQSDDDEDMTEYPNTTVLQNNTRRDYASSRREDSATRRKQILNDLIHNPTGNSHHSKTSFNFQSSTEDGSGDWKEFKGHHSSQNRNTVWNFDRGSQTRMNGDPHGTYKASFASEQLNGGVRTKAFKPKPRATKTTVSSSHQEASDQSTTNENGSRKTKKSYTRTRKL